MARIQAAKFTVLAWLWPLVALLILMAGCGGGVSNDEFSTVQSELQAARSQVELLESEVVELRTQVTEGVFEDIGELLSINQLMAFPPTIVELNSDSATVEMITKVPTTCSIAYGLGLDYGDISTDHFMMVGAHTNHNHLIEGLQADTLYHYKWGLLGPDGTLYGSEDLTFTTPPEAASN